MVDNLQSLHPHERDKYIRFNPIGHIYTVYNVEYTSVTRLTNSTYHYEFPENPSIYLKKCIDDGNALHSDINTYYKSGESSNTKEFNHFMRFINRNDTLQPYRSEWAVFNEDIFLSGTIDMIYKNKHGTYDIYDWKRSANINKDALIRYTMQLNLYAYILESKYNMRIENMFLLSLHPSNVSYKQHKVDRIDLIDAFRQLPILRQASKLTAYNLSQMNKKRNNTNKSITKSKSKSKSKSSDSINKSRRRNSNGHDLKKTDDNFLDLISDSSAENTEIVESTQDPNAITNINNENLKSNNFFQSVIYKLLKEIGFDNRTIPYYSDIISHKYETLSIMRRAIREFLRAEANGTRHESDRDTVQSSIETN